MKIVLQKVKKAHVEIHNKIVGEIADGFCLLVGVTHEDTEADADKLIEKILKLRLFAEAGSDTFMEKNIVDARGGILVVSNFTLYGNCKKGTRPSFTDAARPEHAEKIYDYFVQTLIDTGMQVASGQFGDHMEVELVNDGPITMILES